MKQKFKIPDIPKRFENPQQITPKYRYSSFFCYTIQGFSTVMGIVSYFGGLEIAYFVGVMVEKGLCFKIVDAIDEDACFVVSPGSLQQFWNTTWRLITMRRSGCCD